MSASNESGGTPGVRWTPRPSHILALLLQAGSRVPGCKQRMLKATPFSGDEDVDEEVDQVALAEAGLRVSLWPFFYHRKPVTSFLWPIGELDFWPLWHL